MKRITITYSAKEGLNVHQGGMNAGGMLTLGEVLEQVASLLSESGIKARTLNMNTPKGWRERAAYYRARAAEHRKENTP